jgi:hypothetical protein
MKTRYGGARLLASSVQAVIDRAATNTRLGGRSPGGRVYRDGHMDKAENWFNYPLTGKYPI